MLNTIWKFLFGLYDFLFLKKQREEERRIAEYNEHEVQRLQGEVAQLEPLIKRYKDRGGEPWIGSQEYEDWQNRVLYDSSCEGYMHEMMVWMNMSDRDRYTTKERRKLVAHVAYLKRELRSYELLR